MQRRDGIASHVTVLAVHPAYQRNHVLKKLEKEVGISAPKMLEVMDKCALAFDVVRELHKVLLCHGRRK